MLTGHSIVKVTHRVGQVLNIVRVPPKSGQLAAMLSTLLVYSYQSSS